MSDILDPIDDELAVQLVEFDDEPTDPAAGDFDDADEGALEDGTPVTSVNGSEVAVWGEDD